MTTTISPTSINEETTHTFTLTDDKTGSNYYYHFYISDNSDDYGTISSFNGLTKQFTFQTNATIDFGSSNSVTQTISYKIYDDYPNLINSPTNVTITFTINNVNNSPSAYIQIIDSTNNTIYVNGSGVNVVGKIVKQDFTLKAKIAGITDADITGNQIADGTGGTYQWWKSTNSIINELTVSNYESYTEIENGNVDKSKLNITQNEVGYFLYVTYKYNDGTNNNIAYSGKTNAIVDTDDVPTGTFYITNSQGSSTPIINTQLYKYFIVGQTSNTLHVTNAITDVDVSETNTVANTSNINAGYKWYGGSDEIIGATNSNYTVVDSDNDTQVSVRYTYTDRYDRSTTIVHNGTNIKAKTPTVLKAFTITATIGAAYTHELSGVQIVDVDGTTLAISLVYVPGSNNSWLSLSNTNNIYTLTGTPVNTNTVGPNQFTLQFKNSDVLVYTFDFTISVGASSNIPSLISIAGDMSVSLNNVNTIVNTTKNFESDNSISPVNSTFGPVQSSKMFTNTLIVSDINIYYNSTKYESTKMKLTFSSPSPSWLSYSINRSETVALNTGLGISDGNIFGNSTGGYYFSTNTAPNTNIATPYKWVFNLTGTPPDTNLQTYTVATNLSDVNGSSTVSFKFYLIVENFRYFLPDNISTPVQGFQFEKFMFVTSSKSQNNISMIVKQKPSWMKIQIISTLNDQDIPTGIISMKSIDVSSPGVCNPSGPFDIVIELRDGSGLIIEFSNRTIEYARQIGNYDTNDFLWMFLNRPDQQLLAPRATAYPCFICSDVDINGDCTDSASNTFTKHQLDMRRKVETLKYKGKTFGYSKAMIASQFARAKQGKKKQWAAQSITNSYPNVNNYTQNGFVLSCPTARVSNPVHIASQSNVPGNKSFPLQIETNVPVVNYVPVRRTYATAGTKFPVRAYKFGDLGFPVGKSGRTPTKSTILTIVFSISGITKNDIVNNLTNIENMCRLLFLGKRTGDDFVLESIAGNATDIYRSSQLLTGNAYTFTIKFTNIDFAYISQLLSTLFINQIITIFNKFFFLTNAQDYRRLCSKIISISESNNTISSINNSLELQCQSNSNAIAVTPITNLNIQIAVNAWITDPATAEPLYGYISYWDTSAVTDMSNLFKDKATFNDDISGWNTSAVTNMSSMFQGATAFNQYIGNWNTTAVANMSSMFQGATAFNQNIGKKTVQTSGSISAYDAWNTIAVTNMSNMFNSATAFNQNIGNWAVNVVADFNLMFNYTTVFNQNISGWDVLSSATVETVYTYDSLINNTGNSPTRFNLATSITNDNIHAAVNLWFANNTVAKATYGEIKNWKTTAVTDMSNLFKDRATFNDDISKWNTSAVTNMSSMFEGATAFNQNIETESVSVSANGTTNAYIAWNILAVTNMSNMFKGATTFNQNIGNWNTSIVTNMSNMFEGAVAFNQDIGTKSVTGIGTDYIAWSTVAVTNMNSMFKSATIFNQYIGNWNTSAVTNMSSMFQGARAFNQDIVTKSVTLNGNTYIAWNTSAITNMSNMFNGALLFNQNIRFWSIISVTNMTNMLSGATAFAATYGTGTTTGYAETPLSTFFLFRPSTKQELINAVNAWTSRLVWKTVSGYPQQWYVGTTNDNAHDTSATTVTSSNNTHNSESRIKFQHISTTAFTLNFDYIVSSEANFDFFRFFQSKDDGTSVEKLKKAGFITGTYSSGSTALTAGTYTFEFSYYKDYSVHRGNDNVQVSNINIGNTAAYNNVLIANWDTSLITDMSELFKNKGTFNNDIRNWNTSAVTNMSSMFQGAAEFNQYIGDWNTTAVTNMSSMFQGAAKFNQNIGKKTVQASGSISAYDAWNTSAVTNMSSMFNGASVFNQNISGWTVSNVTNSTEIFTDCSIIQPNKPTF